MYLLNFVQAPADFIGSGVGLHFSANKMSYYFLQWSFLDMQDIIYLLHFDR
jgi:hypothetical protein